MDWIQEIVRSRNKKRAKYLPYQRPEDGLLVIEACFESLSSAVMAGEIPYHMKRRAIDLAATTLRFLEDCCE